MPALKELYLAANQLTSFKGLCDLPVLEKLHLRGNKFIGLDDIPVLDTVTYLNLRDNLIESTPEAVEG